MSTKYPDLPEAKNRHVKGLCMIIRKDSYLSLLDEMTKMWVSLKGSGLDLAEDWNEGLLELREKVHEWDFSKILLKLNFETTKLFRAAAQILLEEETLDQTFTWIQEVVCMWSRERVELSLEIGN